VAEVAGDPVERRSRNVVDFLGVAVIEVL
jgi:hypothetical protein